MSQQPKIPFTRADGLVLLGILLGAILHSLAQWQGRLPFVYNGGDIQQVLGFMTADALPGQFGGDLILADPKYYRMYWTIHTPLIQGLSYLVGDLGTAAFLLLPLQLLLFGVGWYLLGRQVLRSRAWAVLFLLVNLARIDIGLETWWGIFAAALPRQTFQGLLAFLFMAAIRFRDQPRAWPFLMVGAGAMLYFHSVSGPTIGFALFVGFWFFWPAQFRTGQRLAHMGFLGLLFLATCLPFAIHYLSSNQLTTVPEQFPALLEAMRYRFAPGHLDLPRALAEFTGHMVRTGILPVALLALAFLRWAAPARRPLVNLFLAWILGILVVGIYVPGIEHAIAAARHEAPLQIDLIRTVRYVVPVLYLLIFLAAVTGWRRIRPRHWQRVYRGGAIGLCGLFVWLHPPDRGGTTAGFVRGEIPTAEGRAAHQEWIEMLEFLRTKTPVSARIATGRGRAQDLAIRFWAQRSLLYTFKDGCLFAYSDHDRMLLWYERAQTMEQIRRIEAREKRVAALAALARNWDATHLLLYGSDRWTAPRPPTGTQIQFANPGYQLLRLVD